jgi:hypothetical protein
MLILSYRVKSAYALLKTYLKQQWGQQDLVTL